MDSQLFLPDFFYQGCQLTITLADPSFSSAASFARRGGLALLCFGGGESCFHRTILCCAKETGLYSPGWGAKGIFQAGEGCDRLFILKYLSGVGVESKRGCRLETIYLLNSYAVNAYSVLGAGETRSLTSCGWLKSRGVRPTNKCVYIYIYINIYIHTLVNAMKGKDRHYGWKEVLLWGSDVCIWGYLRVSQTERNRTHGKTLFGNGRLEPTYVLKGWMRLWEEVKERGKGEDHLWSKSPQRLGGERAQCWGGRISLGQEEAFHLLWDWMEGEG